METRNEKPNYVNFVNKVQAQIDSGALTLPPALADHLKELFEQRDKYIDFTRINSDTYGNPRYVCHYLCFITDKDRQSGQDSYQLAVNRAKKIGGGRYNNKSYGGGIVFQSYNIDQTARDINNLIQQYK